MIDNDNDKDYAGGGEMTTEELEQYLDDVAKTQQAAAPPAPDGDSAPGADTGDSTGDGAAAGSDDDAGGTQPKGAQGQNGPDDTGASGDDDGQDEEYDNIVDYLNKQHKLGLEIGNLPEDMSREQEAEVISDLFQKTVNGVNKRLSQYGHIDQLLQDEETKAFLKAKSEGKTMRDIASQYATSIDGMGDEAIVAEHLKKQFPDMEQEELAGIVDSYKNSDKLTRMAELARNFFSQEKEQQAQLAQQQQEVEQQRMQQEYQEDVASYQKFVNSTTNIFGVPLDDRMKQDILTAAVQADKDGMTYLEKALQTDEGTLLATAGILYMKKLMNATASTEVNRRNKKLADRLFDRPDKLQSGGQEPQKTDFNPDVANTF